MGRFTVEIARDEKGVSVPKSKRLLEAEMEEYHRLLAAQSQGSKAQGTIGQAQRINQESYSKIGVTHGIRFVCHTNNSYSLTLISHF
jgi:hypothetical protein